MADRRGAAEPAFRVARRQSARPRRDRSAPPGFDRELARDRDFVASGQFGARIPQVRFRGGTEGSQTRCWRERDSNPRSLSQRVAFSGSHHAEFVDDHPSSFQIGEHSIRLQRIT
jgi:hypothetical protein